MIKRIGYGLSLVFGGLVAVTFLNAAPLDHEAKLNFTVSQASQVPGATLSPGNYSIHIVDFLDDRSILQVKDGSGKVLSSFVGLRRPASESGASAGLTSWSSQTAGQQYFRAWVLPNRQGMLEFAYPKADAVVLAKSTNQPVPAIDPESEGKPAAGSLSNTDMQVVSLWLLSASTVGSDTGETSIKAEHFHADGQLLAKAAPVAARLPHTASATPMIGLAGLASLAMAGLLLLKVRGRARV